MREELLRVLGGLSEAEWQYPTACTGWSVKDVALHLLGDDIGLLSRRRDGFSAADAEFETFEQVVAFINLQNDIWLRAARRMSPAVLLSLLEVTGKSVHDWANALDPDAVGAPVDWVTADNAPVWMELAREYTEYWAHHQHICNALDEDSLLGDYRFTALAAYSWALPRAYGGLSAPARTTVQFTYVDGDETRDWYVMREMGRWRLLGYTNAEAATQIRIPADVAWRLFTKGVSSEAAREAASIEGDEAFAEPFFETVGVLA